MKSLPVLACLLASAFVLLGGPAPVLAQRVILPLDKGYPEDQFFFLTYNDESRIELRADAAGFNGKATRATWRLEAGAGGLSYVGFGYFHGIAAPANPFPDLSGYTHLSLWYTNTTRAPGAEALAFRFELYEREVETDGTGRTGLTTWVYESANVLTTASGWTQLLMPLTAVEELGEAGFAIPPDGFAGNGVLDLDRIRHWGLVLVADGVPVGTVHSGVTLFDYLTAEQRTNSPAAPPEALLATGLGTAYPNPFASDLTVPYTLERPAEASVRLFDLMGREVAVPVPPQPHAAGPHVARITSDGLAAGVYVCVLTTGGQRYTHLVTHLP